LNTATVSEKRGYTRAEVNWPVVILTMRGAMVAETKNISASGAFIFCGAPLHPKEKLRVFIMAPNRSALNVTAEVAWSNPLTAQGNTPPCGLAIRFTRISAADRQFLRDVAAERHGSQDKRGAEKR